MRRLFRLRIAVALMARTIPQAWANVGRVGLDFWQRGRDNARNSSYFTAINAITCPGPDGAMPSVRLQLFREGVQDAELRQTIIQAYLKLPEEKRQPYRALLDELPARVSGSIFLGQNELALDLPTYRARLQVASAELAGVKSEAKWEQPPNE